MCFFCCIFAAEMINQLLHICPNGSADARMAAEETMSLIRAYIAAHPDSELHTCGKMFGVLIVLAEGELGYLRAFSAMLDGTYSHEGFVPPIYSPEKMPIGHNREESQRLQRLLFANYNILNTRGERRNLLDIFANEKPILSRDEWFGKTSQNPLHLPPCGAGECCAPKLLQYALQNGWKPIALAEFWIGAAPKNELRREGQFYPPCSGKCKPILRWMLGNEKLEIAGLEERENKDTREVDILFEDEWLMVVNKPAGILSVPGRTDELSVGDILNTKHSYPFMQAVHRLDQDTSGLLVLAKSPDIYKTLQAYFQRRDILKRYEAVIKSEGTDINDEGTIELPLLPDPFDRPRQMVDLEHGKVAQTYYKVRERRPDGTILLDMFPRTGRTHQLRVHAAHPQGLNAPIVGDRLYGEAGSRLMLHAAEIRFAYPITKEEMHFCIPSNF